MCPRTQQRAYCDCRKRSERFPGKWYLSWVAKNESSRVELPGRTGLSDRSHAKPQVQRKPRNSGIRQREAHESAAPRLTTSGSGRSLSARIGAQSGGGNRTRTHPPRTGPSPSVGPQVPPGESEAAGQTRFLKAPCAGRSVGLGPLTRYLPPALEAPTSPRSLPADSQGASQRRSRRSLS